MKKSKLFAAALAVLMFIGMGSSALAGQSADDANNGGGCDGNQRKNDKCPELVVTDVTVEVVADDSATSAKSGDKGAGGKGSKTNPDCNESGPERTCGQEDGDHNQGGSCDGNERRKNKGCDKPTPDPDPDPKIGLTKSGPASVNVGDSFTYTFEATNLGKGSLKDVVLTDPLLNLTQDLPDLKKGESAKVEVTSVAPNAAATIVNTAEVCGTTAKKTHCDTDDHTVTVVEPGVDFDSSIEIVKTASVDSVDPGNTVTFTYVVTNTGEGDLTNILVTDDILGDITTIDVLAEGQSITATKEMLVAADSPRTNIGTACGTDGDGDQACDTDDETISIVLPLGPQGRSAELPNTGFPMFLWIAGGLTLIAAGLATQEQLKKHRS